MEFILLTFLGVLICHSVHIRLGRNSCVTTVARNFLAYLRTYKEGTVLVKRNTLSFIVTHVLAKKKVKQSRYTP
jgi:hypothetical protein